MRTTMVLLFAGAMSTSALLATTNNQWSEERMKAKTGRYSPAEEARREKVAREARDRTEACEKQSCCRHRHAPVRDIQASASTVSTNSVFASKLGRTAPVAELHAHGQRLVENPATTSVDAWWRSKWGRTMTGGHTDAETAALVAGAESRQEAGACCD